MRKMRSSFMGVCLLTFLLAAASAGAGQAPAPAAAPAAAPAKIPAWDLSVAAFGGGAFSAETDIDGTDATVGAGFTIKEAALKSSGSYGGKISAWSTRFRANSNLDFGAELDVTHFASDVKGQTVSVTGPVAGVPFVTASTVDQIDLGATIVGVNLLARFPVGVSPELPHGRWYPYLGIGGGGQFTRAQVGALKSTDATGVLQALVGFKFFLTRNGALFGESKLTHANHTFDLGTTRIELNSSVIHLVGGLAVHF